MKNEKKQIAQFLQNIVNQASDDLYFRWVKLWRIVERIRPVLRDHPLYQKESQKRDTCELHIARLLTQEICLMKDPRNPRQAFQRQSKLLRDALIGAK